MAVIRVNKTSDYTIMGNSHLKERDMSLKAKGLLSMMLSLPDNWDYSVAGLVSVCKESESSIKTALNELKKFGYLVITKKLPNQTESGKIEYEYNIYEYPKGEGDTDTKQEGGFQGVDFQAVENQAVENQGQYNTNNKYTNKSITKDKDIHTPVMERFNRICVSLPRVTALTDKRKKVINARLKQHSMVEIEEVFLLAESSDFLKGANGKWKATFDWLMNENNFVKVLEGNYKNKLTSTPLPKQTEHDRFMDGLKKFVEDE
jgi:hypothetical protein